MVDYARITQQYIEVAIDEDSEPRDARITQQYIEAAILTITPDITFEVEDDSGNALGYDDALFDDYTTAEFEAGTLTDVRTDGNLVLLDSNLERSWDRDSFGSGIPSANCRGYSFTPTENFDISALRIWSNKNTKVLLWRVSDETLLASETINCVADQWNVKRLSSAVSVVTTETYIIALNLDSSYDGESSPASTEFDSVIGYVEGRQGDTDAFPDDTTTYIPGVGFNRALGYKSSGTHVSAPVSVGSYAATEPDLKIAWQSTEPTDTDITIETGTSDSDSTEPTTWYEQSNGSSISDLPADLTGKYLWYKATLETTDTDKTPELKWVVSWDDADSPDAAVRINCNDEIKAVPDTGTVDFTVPVSDSYSYTAYLLELGSTEYTTASESDSVTVVESDVTETVVFTAVSTGYDLAIGAGAYTLTGFDVSFKHRYNLTLGGGEYNVTGSDVTLTADRTLALGSGEYNLTGSDVSFKHTYTLSMGSGAHTLTGTDIALTHDKALSLGSGAYTLTGTDVDLFAGTKTMFAGIGAYTLTGTAVDLLHHKTLSLGSGAYSLTGTAVDLVPGTKTLVAGTGEYTLTGTVLPLLHHKTLTLGPGEYTTTGSAITMRRQVSITLGSGAYSLTGGDMAFATGKILVAGAGAYTLTGSDITLKHDKKLSLGAGAYALTGSDVVTKHRYHLTMGSTSYTLTGSPLTLQASRKLTIGAGAYTLTGTALGFGFATTEEARAAQIVYLFTLTGTADGTTDVEIPIKTIQARMRSGSPTYLTVSIPGLTEYEGYVNARPNGTMEIDVAYLEDGAYTLRETIMSVTLDDIRVDEGPFSKSITLTGRQQKTYANKSITLYRPIYKNTLNGNCRYRFAEPHMYLFPGDTVTVGDDTLTANVISYYVAARTGGMDTTMEVAETEV